ncbi:hypothetical protein MITSMUL_03669 [Mitsuokella multacida DSM 20544]|uniref:Uncharacterized protein n=1 Tax=Mitsuokella multacida DSM 20544 TaxID=500635 RepID=C9KKH0_9FIRM|nr:hypothetical protein MITSMUL_03669 [Mitsuokella multacida DSM 20544]
MTTKIYMGFAALIFSHRETIGNGPGDVFQLCRGRTRLVKDYRSREGTIPVSSLC